METAGESLRANQGHFPTGVLLPALLSALFPLPLYSSSANRGDWPGVETVVGCFLAAASHAIADFWASETPVRWRA